MPASHKALIRQYFDLQNSRRWTELHDFFRDNFTEDFVIEIESFVDRGFSTKKVDGKAIVNLYPYGRHPVEGKLKEGDEICSVQEAGRKFETLSEILYGDWGANPEQMVHMQVRREGETFEVDFTPVINKAGDWPYSLDMWEKDFENSGEKGEHQSELLYMVEEDNQVACFISATGRHKEYHRIYAYTQAWIFEFRGDKIARFLEVHNTIAEYMALGYQLISPGE